MSLSIVTVRSQTELDKLSSACNTEVKIAFGDLAHPADVHRQLKYPVRIEPGFCAAVRQKNKVRHARRCTIFAYDQSVIGATSCTVYATDNAYISAKGESKVVLSRESYADLWDACIGIATEDSCIEAHDESSVEARDSSVIFLWDSATAVIKSADVEVENASDVPESAITRDIAVPFEFSEGTA